MTKERNDGIPDPEEAYPIGEDGVQADEDTESPVNENVESQIDKPEHSLFESGGRTTGGIEPSDYSFESNSVTKIPVEEYEDVTENTEETPIFETEEVYEKTESYAENTTYFEPLGDQDKSALKGMLSFFTIWRRDVGSQDIEAMEDRFHLVPVIGALFATVIAVEMIIMYVLGRYTFFDISLIIPIFVLATVLIGSKFLHFDGLVDFGDGIVASGDQEKHVRAMKDSKIGAGGFGLALIVTLGTFAIYAHSIFWIVPMLFVIPITEILVKNAMVSAAVYGTAGDGMASSQVRKADNTTLVKSLMTTFILSIVGLVLSLAIYWIINKTIIGVLDVSFAYTVAMLFIVLVVGMAMSVLVGKFMANTANKTFGYTSGDTLGATNEIARPIVSFTMILTYCVLSALILL